MNFNFSDAFEEASEEGFGPSEDLTPGTYEAAIVAANVGESKAGDPKLGFWFRAAEGSTNDEGDDVSGDTIWLNLTFSENGAKYAARDAKSLGLTDRMLNSDPEAAVETAVGQVWRIKVEENGEWMNARLRKRLDDEPAKPKKKAAKKRRPEPEPEEVEEDEYEDEEEEEEAPAPKKRPAKKAAKKRRAKPAPEPEEDEEEEEEYDDDDDEDPWDL
jgi:hypothetical protein